MFERRVDVSRLVFANRYSWDVVGGDYVLCKRRRASCGEYDPFDKDEDNKAVTVDRKEGEDCPACFILDDNNSDAGDAKNALERTSAQTASDRTQRSFEWMERR